MLCELHEFDPRNPSKGTRTVSTKLPLSPPHVCPPNTHTNNNNLFFNKRSSWGAIGTGSAGRGHNQVIKTVTWKRYWRKSGGGLAQWRNKEMDRDGGGGGSSLVLRNGKRINDNSKPSSSNSTTVQGTVEEDLRKPTEVSHGEPFTHCTGPELRRWV